LIGGLSRVQLRRQKFNLPTRSLSRFVMRSPSVN
jgi:hypothetical protein